MTGFTVHRLLRYYNLQDLLEISTCDSYLNINGTSHPYCCICWKILLNTNEPVHEISSNVVCATNKASDQPAHMRSLIRAFPSRLSIL